jgi:Mn2+/Fe2+ NRAMP family transporter
MRSVFVYTASRLALFAATAGVLFLVGARGFLLLALAILISGVVSFVLLSRQRDAVSDSVTERASRMRRNLAEGAAREDGD